MKRLRTNFSCKHALFCIIAFVSCTSDVPKDVTTVDQLPAIWPDYIDVTIPLDIAPLNFAMADDSVDVVDVVVKGEKGGGLHAGGEQETDFDLKEWHQLLQQNRGAGLTLTVCARKEGRWTQYRDFNISVSNDSIGDWGITYRRIAPGYEQYGAMGLYRRCLADFNEEVMVDNNGGREQKCLNCHTANATNPAQYVYHIRGDNGGTVLHRTGRTDTITGPFVYPYWHPGGRYCAFSTNKTSQMFHTANNKRIEVYDSSSDVFIYDCETGTTLKDTLIMKTLWAENTPAFSHDGRWLYFTTARRQVYPTDYDKERYSLCRVAFDEKTGRLGTTVDTLLSADKLGKSFTWPRPSYDGRYLMYTQTDYGYFSIWHPEADLWLLDLDDSAECRPLSEVNSSRADSFHNWSSNSRWFLFTSRRDDGLYSRIYISSINDEEKATKPFLLPQRHPKDFYRRLLFSYNTPDFVSQ